MTAAPHHFPVEVLPGDIDFMGHVNNASYLRWVQDGVVSHWQRFAPADVAAAHQWVALRHEITYRRPAFLRDSVTAEVLLKKVWGVRAAYDTVIRRGEDVLAEVTSIWCCLDIHTSKPKRLAKDIIDRFMAG